MHSSGMGPFLIKDWQAGQYKIKNKETRTTLIFDWPADYTIQNIENGFWPRCDKKGNIEQIYQIY